MTEVNLSINGKDFIIVNNNGIYNYYKIVNGVQVVPSVEELQQILIEIQKLNKPISFEEAKKNIIDLINKGEITTIEQLKDYINTLGLTERTEELLEIGSNELGNVKELTPIDILREEIINEIRKPLNEGDRFNINFQIEKDFAEVDDLMKITVFKDSGNTRYTNDNLNKYVKFDDKAKKDLLEPILREIILKNRVVLNEIRNITGGVNYRANYYLNTMNNYFIKLLNVEQTYAEELQEMLIELQTKYGNDNNFERVDEIEAELSEEKAKALENDELSQGLDNELVRKRVKPEENGYVNLMSVFIVSEFIAVLFILLQLFILI